MEGKTVLIVGDSVDNWVIYGLFLEHFGIRVRYARNGREGVQKVRRNHPDLVLMDISMPIMNGLDATRLLRADESTASIPIIVITAHSGPETREAASECGCNAFIGKPVPPSRLAREVQRFLESQSASES